MKPWIAWLLVRSNSIVVSGRYLREPAWTPSEQFEQNLLDQKQGSGAKPCTLGSVVAYNESYMDVVDWAYQKVGPPEVMLSGVVVVPTIYLVIFYMGFFFRQDPSLLGDILIPSMLLPMIIWFARILFNTFTGYTHYCKINKITSRIRIPLI